MAILDILAPGSAAIAALDWRVGSYVIWPVAQDHSLACIPCWLAVCATLCLANGPAVGKVPLPEARLLEALLEGNYVHSNEEPRCLDGIMCIG